MSPSKEAAPRPARIGHVCLEVSDLVRSSAFYDRFLGRLGFHRFALESDYAGYANGELSVWLVREARGRIRRHPITGEEDVVADHYAFLVSSRDEVEAVQNDLERSEVYPVFRFGEHPEFRPGYVSVTWMDPDNIVLEVYHVPPPKTSARRPGTVRKRNASRREKSRPRARRGRRA